MQVGAELISTENKAGFARQSCNNQVMACSNREQSFPQDLLAGASGHGPDASLPEFEGNAQFQAVPKVSF